MTNRRSGVFASRPNGKLVSSRTSKQTALLRVITIGLLFSLPAASQSSSHTYCDDRIQRCGLAYPGRTEQGQPAPNQGQPATNQGQQRQLLEQQRQLQQQQRHIENARQHQQLRQMYERQMDSVNRKNEADATASDAKSAAEQLEELTRTVEELNRQGQPPANAQSNRNHVAAPVQQVGAIADQQRQQGAAAADNPFGKESEPLAQAKDPNSDYAGQPCAYFTKPHVRPDGSGTNFYADGTNVCYGERMYKCEGGVWGRSQPCKAYPPEYWQSRRAETLE